MSKLHFNHWPRHLSHGLSYPQTGVYEHLQTSAQRYPDKSAVNYYGSQITYATLNERIERFAGYLSTQLNVQSGDCVVLCMQNSVSFIIAYYAVLRCDAIVVPVNPMNKTLELEWYITDTESKIAIVGSEIVDQFEPLCESTCLSTIIAARYADDLFTETKFQIPETVTNAALVIENDHVINLQTALKHEPIQYKASRNGEDLAVILYTSGTTAHPKGCMLSHRALVAQILTQINWCPWNNTAKVLAVTPFFHVTGMINAMCLPIWLGATTYLMTRWDRLCAAQVVDQHALTHWCCIPTMVVDLLAMPNVNQFNFKSFICVYGGGTGMPHAIAQDFETLTGIEFIEGWGMTEMTAGVHLNPYGRGKRQCLGIPLFDVDSRIVDPETGEELGVRQSGEIISTSPCLFSGYWKNPEATEKAFIEHDGKRFFKTGDVGYYDEEGYFFMADRLKRMINVSGYKVWPSEVESILYKNEKVLENCIIPCSKNDRGESVKAIVVLKHNQQMTSEELTTWCREQMSAYKVPKVVEFVAELPKTASGKINWRLLQDKEMSA
ncbi:long-chain-fatty-acid--CoA ligase [Acinetobacter equi]|uniref:Long-chain fatty acid--CoA ligase n=1 Tax=Acinetobacter equi TaxID=1324350 RepID=A0A0N9W3I8_9GAMM|nr:long-chain-fatty-acid--CoA ligase [Acinetobacter equi]ALH96262.1 long-chain fatty acid--CoA ligase [Acinetobacter equi]